MSEIKRLIEKGESKTVEFKAILPEGKKIAKSVVAFSNMAGGKIIVPVGTRFINRRIKYHGKKIKRESAPE